MENEPQAEGTQPKQKSWGWVEYVVLLVLIGIVVIGGLTLLGGKVSAVYSFHHYNYLERHYNRNYNVDPPAREYNEADKSRNYLPVIRK